MRSDLAAEAARIVAELEKRRSAKFATFFPDTGPLRRDLYPKHVEFFALGASYKNRLFMAANRVGKCCVGSTQIETTDGPQSLDALYRAGRSFGVWAWDGTRPVTATASAPFSKGRQACYRVTRADGSWIECADEHRILTDVGWQFVRDLHQVLPSRPVTSVGYDPQGLRADARHWWQTPQGWWDRCCRGFRRGDGRLPWAITADPVSARLQGDARPHTAAWSHGDGLGNSNTNSALLCDDRRPSWGDQLRRVGQCVVSASQTACTIAAQWCGVGQVLRRQRLACLGAPQCGAVLLPPVDGTSGRDAVSSIASNRIISVEPIGIHEVFDFEVERYHNYLAHGMVHHNSEAGAYEVTCHLTGLYPHWWTGRRFSHPVEIWACGTNSQTTRDIVQAKLLGPSWDVGSGTVPHHLIADTTTARGLPGAIETAYVKHTSGGTSVLSFKSYEQGRSSFEGTAKHVVWCDEEPPQDVYTELMYRTITTKGIVIVTFTPLQGMSDVVRGYLEPESDVAHQMQTFVQAGWEDVPHLDADEQKALLATTPLYQIAARTKGEPALGSGAIYPIAESDVIVPTAPIPDEWPKAYGMDVGWNRTAVVWGAINPASGVVTLYDEHYQAQGEPASHAAAVRARGDWMRGVIDPASLGSSQIDGRQLMEVYAKMGLHLDPAVNAVEAGLTEVWNLLVSGRLKVQAHLHNWRSEFRKYHRDDKGRIVKAHDHLMDATRYLIVSGRAQMRLPKVLDYTPQPIFSGGAETNGGWLSS